MNPKVSVIIPCYNYGRYLTDAVESVLHQTFQDFEIIIVNDGSTDDTELVAKSLIERYNKHRITFINQSNSGQPAISRNNGIKVSKGEYILCLDADDKLAPTMLEECVAILDENSDIAIAYTDRLDFDGVEEVVQAGEYDFEKLKYQNHISYCALYRREVWEAVGGYRTNIVGSEDWDFWIAAGAKGFRGKRIPKPLFMYRRHDTGLFQYSLPNMKFVKAQIILNNSQLYNEKEIADAIQFMQEGSVLKDKKFPVVSVILTTYNRPNQLSKAIQSVLKQSYKNFEIIIVNDGGVDVTDIVNEHNKNGDIIYVKHEVNKGPSSARNTGIKMARGKYITYLDDDDIFYFDHLQTLVSFLESTEFRVAYTDANRSVYSVIDGKYVLREKTKYFSGDFDSNRILVENFIPILCVMHERSCIEEVGMFDETLRSHEDWDLWIRMAKKFSFGHIPQVTCEFSWVEDDLRESQRRVEFLSTLLTIYDKYRTEAENNPEIIHARDDKLKKSLSWAYNRIKGLEIEKAGFKEKLNQKDFLIHNLNAKLAAIQDNLSWRILNRYVFSLWDKWIIPFGSRRRAILEKFFRKKVFSSTPQTKYSDSTVTLGEETQTRKRVIKKSGKLSDLKKFIVYSNSKGNYFFSEIRDLIAEGIRELGFKVDIKDETNWLRENDAWHIVVAPHEFFYLGELSRSETEYLPENLIIVNTEQPSTKWASLAENYFSLARYVWDINYDSAKQIAKHGIKSAFLPLGFTPRCYLFQEVIKLPVNYATCHLNKTIRDNSFFNEPFTKRPIDITFVGALTPRREEFFSSTAKVTSKYKSFIHLSDGLTAPIVPGITTYMNTDIVLGIMQRSRISLNIHHGSDKYFEWHRIVLLGIAQKTLVISEPCISSPIFQAGVHYVEANLDDIPAKIEYYLSTSSGKKEAEGIIEKAYQKFVEDCKIKNYLDPLIKELDKKNTV